MPRAVHAPLNKRLVLLPLICAVMWIYSAQVPRKRLCPRSIRSGTVAEAGEDVLPGARRGRHFALCALDKQCCLRERERERDTHAPLPWFLYRSALQLRVASVLTEEAALCFCMSDLWGTHSDLAHTLPSVCVCACACARACVCVCVTGRSIGRQLHSPQLVYREPCIPLRAYSTG